MRFSAMNLKYLVTAALCSVVLLCGPAAYGQRKAEHRALKEHQKYERRAFKERWSNNERRANNNRRYWREQRHDQRIALRRHQQAERRVFRQTYNPGRRVARGRYYASGQRRVNYYGRRINYRR